MKNNFLAVLLMALCLVPLAGQERGYEVGDKVKPFKAIADNGRIWKAKKVLGNQNLVVYFYPAAMTGGCTKQACAYRDNKADLEALDAVVVGISADSSKNLHLFKVAHQLNFPLLSDPEGKIAALFGVPIRIEEKSIVKTVAGIEYTLTRNATASRWTFVIDKTGKVVSKSTDVDAAADSKAVVEILKSLNKH